MQVTGTGRSAGEWVRGTVSFSQFSHQFLFHLIRRYPSQISPSR